MEVYELIKFIIPLIISLFALAISIKVHNTNRKHIAFDEQFRTDERKTKVFQSRPEFKIIDFEYEEKYNEEKDNDYDINAIFVPFASLDIDEIQDYETIAEKGENEYSKYMKAFYKKKHFQVDIDSHEFKLYSKFAEQKLYNTQKNLHVDFSYPSLSDKENWVSMKFTFKNVGATKIRFAYLTTTLSKYGSIFSLGEIDYAVFYRACSYSVKSDKYTIAGDETLKVKLNFLNTHIPNSPLSYNYVLYFEDDNKNYWSQGFGLGANRIQEPIQSSYIEFNDEFTGKTNYNATYDSIYWAKKDIKDKINSGIEIDPKIIKFYNIK